MKRRTALKSLMMATGGVVHSILVDGKKTGPASGKATGVRVIDANTKQETEYFAKIIFVNAACLNSSRRFQRKPRYQQ